MGFPDLSFEQPLWEKKYAVIGIDEVGRGAFAGPVGVGGVAFDPKMSLKDKKFLLSLGINDSKKLSQVKREKLSLIIKELALAYFVTFIDVSVVNDVGVGRAAELGMIKVAKRLVEKIKNPYLLIDAFKISADYPQKNIIKGDSLSISIASASIIAKVERDKLMRELSKEYPVYGFDKHKGYGTLYHRRAISEFGLSNNHRKEFCKNYINL